MTTVLLIIQLLVAAALIAVILLQRSEGGALGMGGSGGGGAGGMMTGRGAANLLTRTTMVLAAIFIGNSIALAVVTGVNAEGESVFDQRVDTPLPALDDATEEADQIPTDG